MYRTALLTTTALVALAASGLGGALYAAASLSAAKMPGSAKAKLLYSQNSNYNGVALGSMNLTSTSSDDNQVADDFVIPKGKVWTITEVDVSGLYYNGFGPANSENVLFYRSANGLPGKPIAKGAYNNLQGSDGDGDFAITLPGRGLRLRPGHYWISVVANMDFDEAGDWGWDLSSTVHGDQAAWRNPGGGYGFCRNWGTLENCVGVVADTMFQLRGKSK